jgi:hypothetical protein
LGEIVLWIENRTRKQVWQLLEFETWKDQGMRFHFYKQAQRRSFQPVNDNSNESTSEKDPCFL